MQILLVFNNNQTDRDGHALKVPSDGPAGPRLGWPLPMGNHRMLYLSHKVVLDIVARQPGFIAIVQPRDHPLTSLELQVQRKEEAARSSAPTPGASLPLYTKTDGLIYQAVPHRCRGPRAMENIISSILPRPPGIFGVLFLRDFYKKKKSTLFFCRSR